MISRASATAKMAGRSDIIVRGTLKPCDIGSRNASMPMKCIDQIPSPVAMAPPTVHATAARRFTAWAIRKATSNKA
jgi:hypothetical protein